MKVIEIAIGNDPDRFFEVDYDAVENSVNVLFRRSPRSTPMIFKFSPTAADHLIDKISKVIIGSAGLSIVDVDAFDSASMIYALDDKEREGTQRPPFNATPLSP